MDIGYNSTKSGPELASNSRRFQKMILQTSSNYYESPKSVIELASFHYNLPAFRIGMIFGN
jgi:hypothetical protein